ncbi:MULTISPECIES: hypothetical protein [Clostridium]|jgi:hypothetical protein|uniref:Uncharacterized protein n=1 Tax=Clostridium saccharoperbutylacetonicum N1-4(HMT) TaxID=931276 RepID=M1MY95_9CLOT|nr:MULTISPECIES: hypothetical protein [Clostridium]AGF56377.1 hypothetical protein Cspa_c26120 [Clostridium saccharoperbutylacetonicum N1-4(HMT)]AQR95118.1 hypothetical protein CLSAP_24320 [Clostridium saccharoperbutylacetonicum]NRT62879.1 hypothetical protein [Clostridium saccharoperbutylacetonicum]NSB26235.1 hypothetical protein [Clostridium saccharoperbutylacetonicum]NSB30965.1 hypothetical protein [Clostridium saccharoperbutylacetonicum]
MEELIKGIKEKAEKMKGEMKILMVDMGDEIRSFRDIMKEKTGEISNEIKKIIR